jgi:hypothetical protein
VYVFLFFLNAVMGHKEVRTLLRRDSIARPFADPVAFGRSVRGQLGNWQFYIFRKYSSNLTKL